MGIFLKYVLTIILILYLLRTFGRFLIKGLLWLVGRQLVKQMEKQQAEAGRRYTHAPTKPEGEITITKKKANDKRGVSDDDGEYVDFEEV
jgi:hypothetical protein